MKYTSKLGIVAAMEAEAQAPIDEKKIKKGAFHEWLGKEPDDKITDADIEKGLASDDPKIRKMANFAKNARKWKHSKKPAVATESNVPTTVGGSYDLTEGGQPASGAVMEDDGLLLQDFDDFENEGGTDEIDLVPVPPVVEDSIAAAVPVAADTTPETVVEDPGHTVTFTTQEVIAKGKEHIDQIVKDAVTGATVVVDPNETQPAPEMLMEATDDVNTDDVSAVECMEALMSMESIFSALKSAVPVGGINKAGADILAITLESIHAKVGLRTTNVIPALESFSDVGTRISSTQAAMESIGDTIKDIWAKIVAFIKKSIAWVKAFFAKIFSNNKMVKARLQKLMEFHKTAAVTKPVASAEQGAPVAPASPAGDVAHEDANGIYNTNSAIIKDQTIFMALQIDNAFPRNFDYALSMYEKNSAVILRENDTPIKREVQILVENFNTDSFLDLENTFKLPKFEIKPLRVTHQRNPNGDIEYTLPDTMVRTESDILFGGTTLQAFVPKSDLVGAKAIEAITAAKVFISKIPPKISSVQEIPFLKDAQIASVFKCVQQLSDDVAMHESMVLFGTSLKEKLLTANHRIISNAAKPDATGASDPAKNREISNMLKINQGVLRLIDQPGLAFSSYVVQTNNALLSYVEKSIQAMHPSKA